MKKTLQKGFTLIELLVVIAIIGILASVILASLNTARAKGADAAAKEDLDNARAQAELYYDSNSANYSGVCGAASIATPGGIKDLIADAAKKESTTYANGSQNSVASSLSTTVCHDVVSSASQITAWAASVPLKSLTTGSGTTAVPTFFCVDSTGAALQTTKSLAGGSFVCS